jgi:hypothetical protein
MQEYFIGIKVCDYYDVHIIEDGYEQKIMVREDDIEGFVKCLDFLGFKQA